MARHRGGRAAPAGRARQRAARSSEESHAAGLLEYPQYTRPREFRGREVPEVLLSGNHARDRALAPQAGAAAHARAAPRSVRAARAERRRTARCSTSRSERSHERRRACTARSCTTRCTTAPGQTVTTAVTNLDVHDIARSVAHVRAAPLLRGHADRGAARAGAAHHRALDARAPGASASRSATWRSRCANRSPSLELAIADVDRARGAARRKLVATAARAPSRPRR